MRKMTGSLVVLEESTVTAVGMPTTIGTTTVTESAAVVVAPQTANVDVAVEETGTVSATVIVIANE